MAALYPALNSQYKFHVDHVFPKSSFHKTKLRKAGFGDGATELMQDRFNRVANLQLLEGLTNESKLATPFDEWIAPMLKADKAAEWAAYKERHAIPELESYGLAKFDEFYEQRRAKLRGRLLEVLAPAS
jgi:hypothetical protein